MMYEIKEMVFIVFLLIVLNGIQICFYLFTIGFLGGGQISHI